MNHYQKTRNKRYPQYESLPKKHKTCKLVIIAWMILLIT